MLKVFIFDNTYNSFSKLLRVFCFYEYCVYSINKKVCKRFNAQTQEQIGKILPVIISVYKDKTFDFVIKTPPAAVQLAELAKTTRLKGNKTKLGGSSEPNRKKMASVTWDQIRSIAENKMPDLNCFTIESAMKMVAGTARSMGFTVSGDKPF